MLRQTLSQQHTELNNDLDKSLIKSQDDKKWWRIEVEKEAHHYACFPPETLALMKLVKEAWKIMEKLREKLIKLWL